MAKLVATQDNSWQAQQERNTTLLQNSLYMKDEVLSKVLPFRLDLKKEKLGQNEVDILSALSKEAARTSIDALVSLAKIGELDHLGGGLGLIPSLMMTMGLVDHDKVRYTIEHAHTSVGYYSTLATLGYLNPAVVTEQFRRSIDIPGHCSTVPGGTELNGGRLGVMVPAAVGAALGMRARLGDEAWFICHTGDAGWVSGQALNGFNAAELHRAPVTFVMHRDGINLTGPAWTIVDKDPRLLISSMGVEILEISSLMDTQELWSAYREAKFLAAVGKPTLIFPVGYESSEKEKITLQSFGEKYGILFEVKELAGSTDMDTEIRIPGSLMSYRDVYPMIENVFLVNGIPGGKCHHDGHMKGRDGNKVLAHVMMTVTASEESALEGLRSAETLEVLSTKRPAPGSPNILLEDADIVAVSLPEAGKITSARAGSEAAYVAIAKKSPEALFVASCDVDVSTKLSKATELIPANQHFELGIEEQVAAILVNGLSIASRKPQLNVFSTFAAFFEGIAREGFEMWRYQRNLNGKNEGMNALFHLSHVGACTGRDHFSGWSLDWINLAIGYLPYLHRFYAPADAGSAFCAVRHAAAHYGANIVGIPRDNLLVLAKQDGSGPLYPKDMEWQDLTEFRSYEGAKKVILVLGAPAAISAEAAEKQHADVYIVNSLPLPEGTLSEILESHPEGVVTVEDGLIGDLQSGRLGFAGVVRRAAEGSGTPLAHVGITDPKVAPSHGHMETWEHFGITAVAIEEALVSL